MQKTKPKKTLPARKPANVWDKNALDKEMVRRRHDVPVLRFTPTAWAKLLCLRDIGPTEVGGFGISAANDLMLIEDVVLIEQQCSAVSVVFDDESVADFFDRQVDAGRRPCEFGRLWLHTHPGDWPEPSSVDEETFERVFGGADWAVMFIIARGGQTYARLQFNVGPRGFLILRVEVDYRQQFAGSDMKSWQQEYEQNVRVPISPLVQRGTWFDDTDKERLIGIEQPEEWADDWHDEWADEWAEYVDESVNPTT